MADVPRCLFGETLLHTYIHVTSNSCQLIPCHYLIFLTIYRILLISLWLSAFFDSRLNWRSDRLQGLIAGYGHEPDGHGSLYVTYLRKTDVIERC